MIEFETKPSPDPSDRRYTAAQLWNAQRLDHALRRHRDILDVTSGDEYRRQRAYGRIPSALWNDLSDSALRRLLQGVTTAIASLIINLAYDTEWDPSTGEERRVDNPLGRDLARATLHEHGWGPERMPQA